MPLHPVRRRERGFNQARLIAQLVGRRVGIPCLDHLVVRTRRTRQQAKIAADDRARRVNVHRAFRSRAANGDGRRLVVVDDIVTSGGTMLAVAGTMRDQGWNVVGGLAVGLSVDQGASATAGDGADATRPSTFSQNVG